MKTQIEKYRQTSMKDVLLKQTKENQKKINDFLDYCRISCSETSIIKITHKIILICDTLEKDLTKLTLEDVRSFLVLLNKSGLALATKNDIKKILKRFLKWNYKDWSSRFNELTDVRLNTKNENRQLTKNDLLTQEEMKLIVNSSNSIKYKTLLILMIETACRPEEIVKIKWSDINNGELKLYSSKTKETRLIPLKESTKHLHRYKEECFYESPRLNEYVFPGRSPNKHLNTQTLRDYLIKLERKTGIKKHLFPYLFRHSVLTRMIKTLSPKVYELYSGHSLETGMRVYSHLDTDDLRKELNKKVYGLEELKPTEREEFKRLKQEVEQIKRGLSVINDLRDKLNKFMLETHTLKEMENIDPLINKKYVYS